MVMDTLTFIAEGIVKMKEENPIGLVDLYQKPTERLNCSSEQRIPWKNGHRFKEILKKVSLFLFSK